MPVQDPIPYASRQHAVTTKASAPNNGKQMFVDLQCTLAKRYDIHQPHSVEAFISHDAEALAKLTGVTPESPEMLLVHEDGNNLDITLFLDQAVITALSGLRWDKHWNGEYFNEFCIVLEGISHFVYLSWNAHYDRPVKLLELELQAEIDKFIFAALEAQSADNAKLISRLFENVQYRPGQSKETRHRYQTANHLAQHYCLWLGKHFDLQHPDHQLRAELARFYRISGQSKINHIRKHMH